MESQPENPTYRIRSYRSEDAPACLQLYREGLLGGKIAENDTGLDMDDIERAYMSPPGSHFWVAESTEAGNGHGGEIIGMIRLPENCANICFGGTRRNRLFMCASQSLYSVYVGVGGAHIA